MLALAVWVYESSDDAQCTARRLTTLPPDALEVIECATVRWDASQHLPRTDLLEERNGDNLARPFFALVLGVVFGLPLLGAAVGSPAGATPIALTDAGISETFINRVRDEVVPGTSALFLLLRAGRLADAQAVVGGTGPSEMLSLRLPERQAGTVLDVFES